MGTVLSVETVRIDSYPSIDWELNGGFVELVDTNPFVCGPLGTTSFDAKHAGSTYWSWHATRCRVGKNWQSATHRLGSIRCFIAPRDGKLELKGHLNRKKTVPKADPLTIIIRVGSIEAFVATLPAESANGIDYALTRDVKKGECIRFIVQKKATLYPNEVNHLVWGAKEEYEAATVLWDPLVIYTDGKKESFQASKAFFTKPGTQTEQSSQHWSYEYRQLDMGSTMLPKDYDSNFSRMIQFEWLREDKLVEDASRSALKTKLNAGARAEAFYKAALFHWNQAKKLYEELREELDETKAPQFEKSLKELKTVLDKTPVTDGKACEIIYAKIRGLKRAIVFANPLMDFGPLFFCKRVPSSYSHLVGQYLGWRARSGGSLFVLKNPGKSLECTDLIDGRLPRGSFLEPRLSWDAKKVVFSFVNLKDKSNFDPHYVHHTDTDQGCFHIYSMNMDGTQLKQLTRGTYDDITPNWLPDGDIIFSSTRRQGFARCYWWGFGRRWNVYTMCRMKPDGSNIQNLSWHETNEWFPEVNPRGLVTYARWDYIDRDAVTHQNLWAMRPDGTNPLAVWGNASPNPMCSFQAMPIPHSQKYIFTASAHHSITAGSLVILDPAAGVDGLQSLQRVTPSIPFPESETDILKEFYESPFPLSEQFFLVSYSPFTLRWEPQDPNLFNGQGIYSLDIFGNRELIYRDSTIGATTPIPVQVRETPPVLPSQLPNNPPAYGEMSITDVYEGLGDKIQRGRVKAIRVIQILPKTTRDADNPPIGLAGEENARLILGTVPVEDDGSAYFRVPAKTPVLLQVLDQDGFAYQTMRSLTYLQPGEYVSCTGCHENRTSAAYTVNQGTSPSSVKRPKAMLREASVLQPGKLGGRTFSYVESIQPIWDRHCLGCHNDTRADGKINMSGTPEKFFTKSYYSLCRSREFWGDNGKDPTRLQKALVPRFGGRNTIQMTTPGGQYGALGCRLIDLLRKGHEGVKLSPEELQTIATWVDLNAVFYGVYDPEEQARQLRGERVPIPVVQ